MGTESSAAASFSAFLLSSTLVSFFLTIRLWLKECSDIERPGEQCLVLHIMQGGDISHLFFVEAMPLSQHSTYHTSSHFLK